MLNWLFILFIYLYITSTELPPTGVPGHWFSSSAGFWVGLQVKCALGKNHWLIACAFLMKANPLMTRFGSIAMPSRAAGQTACSQMVGFCESANFAKFATLRLRKSGHSCFSGDELPGKVTWLIRHDHYFEAVRPLVRSMGHLAQIGLLVFGLVVGEW